MEDLPTNVKLDDRTKVDEPIARHLESESK